MPFLINRCQKPLNYTNKSTQCNNRCRVKYMILFIDYDVKEVLRYKCIHLKDVILGQNHQGVVNRVDRVMYMTVLDN
jgi:hypothetical protein